VILKFCLINRNFTETISLSAFFKGGKLYENKENNGIGELFSRVWTKSNLLLEKSEFYGSYFNTHIGSDAFEITLNSLDGHFKELLQYLKCMFEKPEFNEKIFEREKQLLLNEIVALKDMPSAMATENFLALTYSNFPYGLPSNGDINTVKNIKLGDIKKYFRDNFSIDNLSLTLSGNYTSDIIRNVEKIFMDLPKTTILYEGENSGIKENIFRIDSDDKIQQAKLYIGYEAPSAQNKYYPTVKVISDYLGGGMSSKYFDLIRKENGFAYSVGAYYPSRCFKSRFIIHIGLDEKNINSAVEMIKNINENFYNKITNEELEAVKKYILGKTLSETQTNSKISWYNSFFMNLGFEENHFDKYISEIEKVDIKEIKEISKIFNNNTTIYAMVPNK
jgi:predicted Zn-dependent peptidase